MIGRFASTLTGRDTPPWVRPACRSLIVSLLAAAILASSSASTALAQGQAAPSGSAIKSRAPRPAPATARPADLAPPVDEPPPGGLTLPARRPAGAEADAPVDPSVIPAAIGEPAAEGGNPGLPGATAPPGGAGPAGGPSGDSADPFVLRPDRLTTGKQQVKLSVEVKAMPVINLGKETPVRIVVNNDGTTDAYGVSVVYQLPDNLQFVSSESPATQYPANPRIYTWNKAMMAAGGEWSIGLKVIPKDTKMCEHVATVTAKAGSKATTTIQEPKLRVEAKASSGRVLKGKQIKFEITVSNPGSGPARNFSVRAKLSDGLRLGDDDEVEQTIDVIEPGKTETLDALMVETVAGGKQTCVVDVRSPDVNYLAEAQQVTKTVEVTKPELTIDLTAQDQRYTGQPIEYKLVVTNTGTAPALGVVVTSALPQEGGKLRGQAPPTGAILTKDRKLFWKGIGQLDPGQSFESKFIYDTSTPRLYRCTAEATSGQLRASKQAVTDVVGIADLDLKVSQTDRVVDVGKTTYYDFVIKNVGTKEATKILCSGTLVNLKVRKPFYEESNGQFETRPEAGNEPGQFTFPEIARLPAGQSITLSLEVEGLRRGIASAAVNLAHDEMGNDKNSIIRGAITTKVTDNNGPSSRP